MLHILFNKIFRKKKVAIDTETVGISPYRGYRYSPYKLEVMPNKEEATPEGLREASRNAIKSKMQEIIPSIEKMMTARAKAGFRSFDLVKLEPPVWDDDESLDFVLKEFRSRKFKVYKNGAASKIYW